MSLETDIKKIAEQSKEASQEMLFLTTWDKDRIVLAWAEAIDTSRDIIKEANAIDVENAREKGVSSSMIDRLALSDQSIDDIIRGLREVAELKDPVGEVIDSYDRPNGLLIRQIRVPIGVIAMIYEARPNVTVDAGALCFKTSNAVILRGGSEAVNSNKTLVGIIQKAGMDHGMPRNAIQLVETTDRDAVNILVGLEGLVDLAIPRGGEGLIRAVTQAARVPVIKHYKGNCHIFIDESADLEQAKRIVVNAKCQRPGVCNAVETILIHEKVAHVVVPELVKELQQNKVEIRGDEMVRALASDVMPATEQDWYEEYLDLILSMKVVPSLEAAIEHINKYGSHHSEAILSKSEKSIAKFNQLVDSAVIYSNASTRFTDGGEFGFGAEIGISTDKLHARGPMALKELTSYKYLVEGAGQIRQ